MKKIMYLTAFSLYCSVFTCVYGEDLSSQLQKTRMACSGISDSMNDLKKMAGINTAITAVGTVSGGIALGTGIAKTNVDEEYNSLKTKIAELIKNDSNPITYVMANPEEFYAQIDNFIKEHQSNADDIKNDSKQLQELEQKSKVLGNVRTGTLATSAVTDTAGTIIAAKNQINDDLQSQISNCVTEINNLKNAKTQAQFEQTADDTIMTKVNTIIANCSDFAYIDLSKINKQAKAAAISSGTGAALAIVGTITSAVANSESVHQNENTIKEKNLNTTSNIMAGGVTGASTVATIFNATQISTIKSAVAVADKCEEALK